MNAKFFETLGGCLGYFLGVIILLVTTLVLGPVLSTLFGLVGGWFVGLFFGETILGFFAQIGITGLAMWQIGAILGFISGFFRTAVNVKDPKK